jgi:hypothetical protein
MGGERGLLTQYGLVYAEIAWFSVLIRRRVWSVRFFECCKQ